jgi:hypothetical protein
VLQGYTLSVAYKEIAREAGKLDMGDTAINFD